MANNMDITGKTSTEQLLELVKLMTIPDKMFDFFVCQIDQKLATSIPEAREEDLQASLEKYYSLYLNTVRKHKTNLQIQHRLGKKLIRDIANIQDIAEAPKRLTRFQTEISPFIEEHQQLQEEITMLESLIVSMLSAKKPDQTSLIKAQFLGLDEESPLSLNGKGKTGGPSEEIYRLCQKAFKEHQANLQTQHILGSKKVQGRRNKNQLNSNESDFRDFLKGYYPSLLETNQKDLEISSSEARVPIPSAVNIHASDRATSNASIISKSVSIF